MLKTQEKRKSQHSPVKLEHESNGPSRNENHKKTEENNWIKEKNKRPYFDQSKVSFDTTD